MNYELKVRNEELNRDLFALSEMNEEVLRMKVIKLDCS